MSADPPGAARPAGLTARLEAVYAAKGPDYRPRTQLLDDGRARYVNRLIEQASPYLLQHAHNPVDWRPWGPEALAEAQALDRPIFLSIGYATCHWCHVMEEESFDNEEVAALLNANFIPIKIDREQRPDLDRIYILATQLQNRSSGWPNSLWLTPEGKPFHTGTYYPRAQFMQVLAAVRDAWALDDRSEILRVADAVADAIARHSAARGEAAIGAEVYAAAAAELEAVHNALEGGFSQAAQFPQEGFLLFLLDHWRRTGAGLEIVTATLDAAAAGGIHDQVGGGFHRYTVDPNWRTPHFEKMLYNQALLSRAFVEAWEAAGDPVHARAATRAFDYALRDMSAPDGAFYAAEDADSINARGELEEGAFYVWPPEAARAALGDAGDYAVETLGLDEPPTIEAGPVAHLSPGETPDFARLDPLLDALRRARDARARPLRDEKVIAGWNGLMIRALAEGGAALGAPRYVAAAARAADAVTARLWTEAGGLKRIHAGGAALEDGGLPDYAWFGLGLLALHDATGDPDWLARAEALARDMLARFGEADGRLRMAQADGPLGPIFETEDGAAPAGESSALELLALLDRRSPDPEWRSAAKRLQGAISGQMARIPTMRTQALIGARVLAEGESAARRPLAGGVARAQVLRTQRDGGGGGWRLELRLAPGWHLNAPDPGPDWLIGAALEGADADWPAGQPAPLGFSDDPVTVLEGDISVPFTPDGDEVTLTVQICSDSICLDPQTAAFRLR